MHMYYISNGSRVVRVDVYPTDNPLVVTVVPPKNHFLAGFWQLLTPKTHAKLLVVGTDVFPTLEGANRAALEKAQKELQKTARELAERARREASRVGGQAIKQVAFDESLKALDAAFKTLPKWEDIQNLPTVLAPAIKMENGMEIQVRGDAKQVALRGYVIQHPRSLRRIALERGSK